ncbi:MAG: nucleotidyltransferase [Prevotellaceae bacterium]|jgi:UTP-glucose-1-phosphate uridylyltransferase|nr:nucleotidyltransferase [Prevotellaceae bacterium]
MQPTLVLMAAGMGSRYGGLKQLDGIGPHGEVIMDYSIYDALRAGFGKVVFVVRRSFEKEFELFARRFGGTVQYDIVLQEIENIPAGYSYPPGRTKPWGTNHAVMMAAPVVREPFAVLNADDYYGVHSFRIMADYLQSVTAGQNRYCMVGFQLGNTLSETGGVSRGICQVDAKQRLTGITECHQIQRINGHIRYLDDENNTVILAGDTPVSMNMWGFTPDYFAHSERLFKVFLQANSQNPKAEFYIPAAVNELIQSRAATVSILPTASQWFGVTYREDRPTVMKRLTQLHKEKVYPGKLF